MRILRVAQKVYPDTKGGGQYHVHALSRDQAERGHDVTVLTTKDDPDMPSIEETDGYTIVRVPPGMTLAGNDVSSAVARYLWGIDSTEFDVVHAHSHLYFSTNLAALKRRLGDIPLAITNHGLYSQSAPEWVFDLYLRTLGRWTFDQADVVFCYTETDKQRVKDLGVGSRIKVVANGIDTERFTPEGPKSKLVESDGPVVLFVGRLVEGKRPAIAVEAFAEVAREYPDAELYLCGDGPLQDELERQVLERGIEDAVTFLGHVPYDEMPKVYRSGDVLVLPSRAEGLPRTVLEAFASGVPVVASDLEQVVSIVEEAGETIPVGNVAGFERALLEVIEDSQRRRELGQHGRNVVHEQFRWQDTVEKTTAELHRQVN